MNKIFKVIRNRKTNQYVAAAEIAKGHGKSSSGGSVTTSVLSLLPLKARHSQLIITVMLGGLAGTAQASVKITDVANGTVSTDAVNVSQLIPLINALGGGAVLNPTTGVVTGPAYTLSNSNTILGLSGSVGDVGSALGRIDSALGTVNRFIKLTPDAVPAGGVDAIASGLGAVAIGSGTSSTGNLATAVGSNAHANKGSGVALGERAIADTSYATSVGASARSYGTKAVAVGFATMVDAGTDRGTAVGYLSKVSANNAVALGAYSLADRANTVSLGIVGGERQVVNMAAGVQDTDGVNVSQLTPVVTALGGGGRDRPDHRRCHRADLHALQSQSHHRPERFAQRCRQCLGPYRSGSRQRQHHNHQYRR